MAEETVNADAAMEAELEAFLGTTKSAAPAAVVEDGTKPKPDAKVPPVASPEGSEKPAAVVETPTAEVDPFLAAIDAIEDSPVVAETPAGEKPALTPDQKAVLDAVPSVEVANSIIQVAQNYTNFTDALAAGKFGDVESMLDNWKPDVLDAWLEYIYEKKMASGEWVDRYLEGGKGRDKDVVKLEKQVAALQKSLDTKKETETETAADQQRRANLKSFQDHITGLFDHLNFNQSDRRWIIADLKIQIAGNPKVMAEIQAGNPKAVNTLFKNVLKEYTTRDKAVADEKGAKIETQLGKKPPIGGGGNNVVEDQIPEDIKDVKKGDEDKWLDKTLNGFLGKMLGKKK